MILPRYLTAVASVDRDPVVSLLVRRELGLPLRRPMIYALGAARLGQADLVLALLRVGTAPALALVELVVGRPVLHCPSQYLRWPVNGVARVRTPRVWLTSRSNPRRPNTPAWLRWRAAFRDGSTVEQCRARGLRKRDVRLALREGWIEIREAA